MGRAASVIVVVQAPNAVAAEDLVAFRQFVLCGGEVHAKTLADLVERALCLAFAKLDKRLVGIGAIKRPNAGYRSGVFAKAGAKLEPAQFEFELGWIYVHPSAREKGVAHALVEALVSALKVRAHTLLPGKTMTACTVRLSVLALSLLASRIHRV